VDLRGREQGGSRHRGNAVARRPCGGYFDLVNVALVAPGAIVSLEFHDQVEDEVPRDQPPKRMVNFAAGIMMSSSGLP
jgi:hypothetical protein